VLTTRFPDEPEEVFVDDLDEVLVHDPDDDDLVDLVHFEEEPLLRRPTVDTLPPPAASAAACADNCSTCSRNAATLRALMFSRACSATNRGSGVAVASRVGLGAAVVTGKFCAAYEVVAANSAAVAGATTTAADKRRRRRRISVMSRLASVVVTRFVSTPFGGRCRRVRRSRCRTG